MSIISLITDPRILNDFRFSFVFARKVMLSTTKQQDIENTEMLNSAECYRIHRSSSKNEPSALQQCNGVSICHR